MEISNYHWFCYLLGFTFIPRLTIMIWVSIYFSDKIPLPLLVIGWIFTIASLGEK